MSGIILSSLKSSFKGCMARSCWFDVALRKLIGAKSKAGLFFIEEDKSPKALAAFRISSSDSSPPLPSELSLRFLRRMLMFYFFAVDISRV
jgi:hypothetical protein